MPPVCLYLGYLIHRFLAQLGLPLIPTLSLLTKKFLSVFCGQVLKEKWVAFSFYLFSSINRVTLVDSVYDPELFFSFPWTTLSNQLCWSTGFMIQSAMVWMWLVLKGLCHGSLILRVKGPLIHGTWREVLGYWRLHVWCGTILYFFNYVLNKC